MSTMYSVPAISSRRPPLSRFVLRTASVPVAAIDPSVDPASRNVRVRGLLLAVPFSLVGAVWLLYGLGYEMSIAVWVGMIALMGLDAETGVFMLLFLDLAYEERKRNGQLRTRADLDEADVMKRIAAPMVGGLATSFVLELLVYPVLYAIWRSRTLPAGLSGSPPPSAARRTSREP